MAYTLEANSISASSTPSQKQVGCIRLAGIFNCCVRQHDPRRCSFIYVPPLIFQIFFFFSCVSPHIFRSMAGSNRAAVSVRTMLV